MTEHKPLFSPDTLADGYEASLLACMRRLQLVQGVVSTIKVMRVSHPQIYMRLCYLAHENGEQALYHAIRILGELGQFPPEPEYDDSD